MSRKQTRYRLDLRLPIAMIELKHDRVRLAAIHAGVFFKIPENLCSHLHTVPLLCRIKIFTPQISHEVSVARTNPASPYLAGSVSGRRELLSASNLPERDSNASSVSESIPLSSTGAAVC